MVTSKAVLRPIIPDREIDREAKKLEEKLDEIDETVAPSFDRGVISVDGVWKHLGDDGPEGEPPDDCERCGDAEPAYVCEFANLPDGTEWIYYCEDCTDWAKQHFAPESVEPL